MPSALNETNRSSVAGTKNKPSMQPPRLKSPQQLTKHREADLPRTPYPMPSKGLKRSVSFGAEEDSTQEGEVKKRKIVIDGSILPCHLASFPSLDLGYPSASQRHGISPVELMKAWESILDQVDWSEVVHDAGGRGKANIYRDVFQTIMQAHINTKRDDEDTDTESGNDSEDGAADGSQHIEDNTFMESDESEYKSEDYTDNEGDDEEDGDDEYQNDDDYEVINDKVSV